MPRGKNRALLLAVLLGLCGCSQAQFVVVEGDHGIVSIPRNTNHWPTYYRKSAEDLLAERYPQGVVIDREEAKVVGEEVTGGRTTSFFFLGMQVDRSTEQTRFVTEWYIHFHAKGSSAPTPVEPAPLPTPSGQLLPEQPLPVSQ